jgi:hypothetical protein
MPNLSTWTAFSLSSFNFFYGERVAYTVLVEKPEGRSPLERTRRRWEENINMDLREVGWESTDRIDMAQDGTGGGFLYMRK